MNKRLSANSFMIILTLIFAILMSQRSFGEEYVYYSEGKRDPFIPLIISQAKISLGLQVVETIEDVKFEGVIFDPFGKSMAVLNDEIVKEGQKIHNVEVVKIYENAITIKIYDNTYTINLVEEGGEAVER